MSEKIEEHGSRLWFIPDGEIPGQKKGKLYSHEAIIITNPNTSATSIDFTFYFRDIEPIRGIKINLEAERMIDIHVNNTGELPIKLEEGKPYSVKIESSVGIIVQYSRLVSMDNEFSLFTTMAYTK